MADAVLRLEGRLHTRAPDATCRRMQVRLIAVGVHRSGHWFRSFGKVWMPAGGSRMHRSPRLNERCLTNTPTPHWDVNVCNCAAPEQMCNLITKLIGTWADRAAVCSANRFNLQILLWGHETLRPSSIIHGRLRADCSTHSLKLLHTNARAGLRIPGGLIRSDHNPATGGAPCRRRGATVSRRCTISSYTSSFGYQYY